MLLNDPGILNTGLLRPDPETDRASFPAHSADAADVLKLGGDVVLKTVDLRKSYFRGAESPVLRGVDVEIQRGEFVSIIGQSGSGKSTLLHLLGALDVADSGEIYWDNLRIDQQSNSFRDRFRNETVGFIFQFYHLLPELDALENVMLPALIRHSWWSYLRQRTSIRQHAKELLARVGLSHRLHHRPSELSGGEMQRVAIARALLSRPQILLADEPTGNLDAQTGASIIELLYDLNRDIGLTILMVTHDQLLARKTSRILSLVEGKIVDTTAPLPAGTIVA